MKTNEIKKQLSLMGFTVADGEHPRPNLTKPKYYVRATSESLGVEVFVEQSESLEYAYERLLKSIGRSIFESIMAGGDLGLAIKVISDMTCQYEAKSNRLDSEETIMNQSIQDAFKNDGYPVTITQLANVLWVTAITHEGQKIKGYGASPLNARLNMLNRFIENTFIEAHHIHALYQELNLKGLF